MKLRLWPSLLIFAGSYFPLAVIVVIAVATGRI